MKNTNGKITVGGRFWRSAFTLIGGLALSAGLGQAALTETISIGNANVIFGGVGSFDVTLTANGTSMSTPEGLAGFSFQVTTSDPHILFTQVNESTTATYVFNGDSFDTISNSCSIISVVSGSCAAGPGATSLLASDFTNDGTNISLSGGQIVGLGHVVFMDTAGDVAGPVTVTLSLPDTSLNDNGTTVFAFTVVNGTITVQAPTVPEPSTLWLLLLAVPALVWARKRCW